MRKRKKRQREQEPESPKVSGEVRPTIIELGEESIRQNADLMRRLAKLDK